MKLDQKIEGYWYSEHEPHYPIPVPNVLTADQADSIYDLILRKQKTVAFEFSFLGHSISRIDGSRLSNNEFISKDWRWPSDFAPHYVLRHRVKPSDEFLKYLCYRMHHHE